MSVDVIDVTTTDLKGLVEERIDRGEPLEEVEEMVRRARLPEDDEEGMLLYAWAWHESLREWRRRGRRTPSSRSVATCPIG